MRALKLSHFSLFLDFDADLTAASNEHCELRAIPSALVISRQPVSALGIRPGMECNLSGSLTFHQSTPIRCPFLGRSHAMDLINRPLIPVNSIDHRDYEPDTIARRLRHSAAYMEFAVDAAALAVRQQHSKRPLHDTNVVLNVALSVDALSVRYATSVWQQLFAIWMQYVAVLVIVAVLARQVLAVAFRQRWVRAWEVVPWKKLH